MKLFARPAVLLLLQVPLRPLLPLRLRLHLSTPVLNQTRRLAKLH
jgi:hypothetical protein